MAWHMIPSVVLFRGDTVGEILLMSSILTVQNVNVFLKIWSLPKSSISTLLLSPFEAHRCHLAVGITSTLISRGHQETPIPEYS